MLTRLKVSGFKSLVDVDVRFGPFTCITGANGAGKSNLFDAILFLSALADDTLVKAAMSVRAASESGGDLLGIFHRSGSERVERIRLEADMILPKSGMDELGQPVQATSTLVRYVVELAWRSNRSENPEAGPIELIEESLVALPLMDQGEHLMFPNSREWSKSVLQGSRKREYISSRADSGQRLVQLHQDGRSGRKLKRPAKGLPRTVLSTVQAEYPTVVLAKREMQSWRLLQLESTALRRPDSFDAPTHLTSHGGHLAAALYHLSRCTSPGADSDAAAAFEAAVYARVSNRLSELIDDVRTISVERNDAHRVYTLQIETRDGTRHPAHALSDGTLRFIALAVTELDRQSGGLLCFEEPENGIHPRRIGAMLELLQEIAMDTSMAVDDNNPLRQVLINTHSPTVVSLVPDDALLVAQWVEGVRPSSSQGSNDLLHLPGATAPLGLPQGESTFPVTGTTLNDAAPKRTGKPLRYRQTVFACLPKTWRTEKLPRHRVEARGNLLSFLNPSAYELASTVELGSPTRTRRVMDRSDLVQGSFWETLK